MIDLGRPYISASFLALLHTLPLSVTPSCSAFSLFSTHIKLPPTHHLLLPLLEIFPLWSLYFWFFFYHSAFNLKVTLQSPCHIPLHDRNQSQCWHFSLSPHIQLIDEFYFLSSILLKSINFTLSLLLKPEYKPPSSLAWTTSVAYQPLPTFLLAPFYSVYIHHAVALSRQLQWLLVAFRVDFRILNRISKSLI